MKFHVLIAKVDGEVACWAATTLGLSNLEFACIICFKVVPF